MISPVLEPRQAFALEAGRTYKARYSLRRATDPSDPSGDTVRYGVQWLNKNKAQISQRIVGASTLSAADGRQNLAMDFSDSGEEGAISWPSTARYARPFVQTYGSDGVTSVITLEWKDITDAGTSSTPERELFIHAQGVMACTPSLRRSGRDMQRVAAVSLAYNIGVAGWCGSTARRRFDAGDIRGGCEAIAMWNKARVQGVMLPVAGLTARRAREREICLQGV
jgi:hypothetical protein